VTIEEVSHITLVATLGFGLNISFFGGTFRCQKLSK
jgi:hypothetical protein